MTTTETNNSFYKDPNAKLDFLFNWYDWLASGETITSASITLDSGITNSGSTSGSAGVWIWLSSGCARSNYDVSCKILTSASRIDERTIQIKVKER